MHEMSLVMRIIDIAQEHALQHNATKITRIELTLGSMSGVMYESLMFSFNIAIKNTLLKDAHICVNQIPAKGHCTQCHHSYLLNSHYDECPQCKNTHPTIIQGQEFLVSSINVI